jgi:hypothetical protein
MKPLFSPSPTRRSGRYDEVVPRRQRFLASIDCEFQPGPFGDYFGGGHFPRRHNFTVPTRSFRPENAVLGLIALVAAWPIASMIHEVIRLLSY